MTALCAIFLVKLRWPKNNESIRKALLILHEKREEQYCIERSSFALTFTFFFSNERFNEKCRFAYHYGECL